MIFPRAMNNTEKAGLKIIKESGLAYEIKFISGEYYANVPELIGTYPLNQIYHFNNHFNNHLKIHQSDKT